MDCLKAVFLLLLVEYVQCRSPGRITDFERRLRRSMSDDRSPRDDDDVHQSSGEARLEDKPHRRTSCCKLGSFLAKSRYNCVQKPFGRADLHRRLHLAKTLPDEIGYDVSDASQVELFSHFRKCVLKKAHEVDRCCLAYSQIDGGSASFDHRKNMKKFSPRRRSGVKCDRSSSDWPRCRHNSSRRHEHIAHVQKSNNFRHNGDSRRENGNWDKWTKYLNFRSALSSKTRKDRSS